MGRTDPCLARHAHKGAQRGGERGVKQTAAKAAGEVGLAVCASALTNIVVFLPIATMTTLVGHFFVPYLGMLVAIYAMGTTFTVFGLLAGIMLVGVVVNAAILIVDERSTYMGRGVPARAATLKASVAKFRPVVMSCSAALFGMLPMALGSGLGSELRAAIGIGSVGGILVSSVVSLYFIPVLCALRK